MIHTLHTRISTCALALLLLLPVLQLTADDFSFDDAFGESAGTAGESSLAIHGEVRTEMRSFVTENDIPQLAAPSADLDLEYTGNSVDGILNLDLDPQRLEEDMQTLIDEAYLRYYGSGYDFEMGYMKIVWGKGDQFHVVDLVNPNDYSDFYNPDYIERRTAVPMTKLNLYVGQQGKLELVYVPTLTPDTVPTEGIWAPQEALAAASIAERYVSYLAAQAYTAAGVGAAGSIAATSLLSAYSDPDNLYPDTDSLEYSQAAVRFTNSLAGIDLGAMYYYGFRTQPSVQAEFADPLDPTSDVVGLAIDYDRLQVIGLEAGAAPAGFNLRAEAAYYLTEDYEGDDPAVHNHSIRYLAGFDRDLPLHNININLQGGGSYRLQNEEIESPYDVEYGDSDDATQTLFVVKVSDSFNHNKIEPEVVARYMLEEECWMISPSLAYSPDDDLQFEVSSSIFVGDEESTFGQFEDNTFVELKGTIMF